MIDKNHRLGRFILLSVLIVLTLPSIPAAPASSQPVTIRLDEAERTAHVGPGDNGTVVFHGIVQNELVGPGQSLQTLEVTLQADAGDWSAAVTPEIMIFKPDEHEKSFTATVRVPPGTDVNETGRVDINGKYRYKPGIQEVNIHGASAIIPIAPYCSMNLSCQHPEKGGRPGDTVRYEIAIANDGNGDERFNISMDILEATSGSAEHPCVWEHSRYIVSVERGKDAIAYVNLTLVRNAPPGICSIEVRASSLVQEERGSTAEETFVLTLIVKERNDVGSNVGWYVLGGAGILSLVLVMGGIMIARRRGRMQRLGLRTNVRSK